MTIGKVTKKNTRMVTKTYNFMKKKTNNLTLKDFAELIEFMNESDDRADDEPKQSSRQVSKPVLGVGHYLSQPSRLNNQSPSAGPVRQRSTITYTRNDLPSPAAPERKKENLDRNPLESTESRQSSLII